MKEQKTIKKTAKPAVAKKTVASKKVVSAEVKKTTPKVTKKSVDSKVSAPLFDLKGKKSGSVNLPSELFSGKINEKLVAQAIRVYLANQRQGNANTKTRSEVKGSRRKVWRQKGTGRARHGSITGPIFVGGGIVHGPRTHGFDMKMPKKMKLQALVSALTEKNSENMVFVFDGKLSGKSKEFASMLRAIVVNDKKKAPSVLFVRSKNDDGGYRASRNVENVQIMTGSDVNTYSVVKSKAILISKDAVEEMKQVFIKA